MSEPRLISPLLDNFDMGGPISDHDGVRCYPAMRKNSDDKYIVKIISVPASETKMDALLLTGAYTDKNAALAYFKDVADGIANEKKILDDLAQFEGFVPFEDCQVVSKEDGSGYEVYLLSRYGTTLKRRCSKAPMTQLDAVNLGLDLCAALSACRRSGYLCVDLKPSNIYIVGDNEFKIGDLGYMKLNSLKYKTLPDMYRSCYTAPEVADAFASLNDKLDIYSVGLILYQIFNGGELPFSGDCAPSETFASPAFADDEMAEIILKACNPDPAERWNDPVQMGQALVNYMQKNGVNDTLLIAENFTSESEQAVDLEIDVPDLAEQETSALEMDVSEDEALEEAMEAEVFEEEVLEENVPADDILEESVPVMEADDIEAADTNASTADAIEEIEITLPAVSVAEAEEILTNDVQPLVEELNRMLSVTDDETSSDDTHSLVEEISAVLTSEIVEEETETVDTVEIEIAEDTGTEAEADISKLDELVDDPKDAEYDNLSFLDDLEAEAAQVLADMGDNYESVSLEISEMLDQIDSLTALEVPDPVVVPEPSEIKIPEEDSDVQAEEETADQPPEDTADLLDNSHDSVATEELNEVTEEIDEVPEEELPYIPKKKRTGLIWCIVLAILLALAAGGYFFYTQYYLQPIHTLDLEGSEDMLQVYLTADIDESELTIVCADPHGKNVTAPVVGGKAVFIGLTPDTAYTISVEVDGFHQLTGVTSKVYSTPIQTKIVQMSAITGSESGSVILSFAVEGPDSEQWNVIYSAEGEAERITAFPSHMVTLTGLTVGKEYTFSFEPIDDIYLGDETEMTYVPKNLVCAENLHVTACFDGALTAQWDTPDGETVSEWTVRCYNEFGYDETLTTTNNSITFQDVDDSVENTVEVIAADMSVNQRILVSANSVTVSDFTVDTSKPDVLTLNWTSNREIPAEGWTILYSVNSVSASSAIVATENSVQIPVVPNGEYVFTVLDGSGNVVLGGPFTHTQDSAADFSGYDVDRSDITVRLCKTPDASSWSYDDLEDEDYVNSFSAGEKVSTVLALAEKPDSSNDSVLIGFSIYDENGNLVSFTHIPTTWQSMWYHNYCELDIPGIPVEIGTYEVIIYFNGAQVGSQKFEVTV